MALELGNRWAVRVGGSAISSDEYVPTEDEVRHYVSTNGRMPADWFDRWLVEHDCEVEARGLEKAEAFIVRDVDGTSFTGTSKIIGVALSREDAEWHASEVKKRDSWHEGSIVAVPVLRAQQVREGN